MEQQLQMELSNFQHGFDLDSPQPVNKKITLEDVLRTVDFEGIVSGHFSTEWFFLLLINRFAICTSVASLAIEILYVYP